MKVRSQSGGGDDKACLSGLKTALQDSRGVLVSWNANNLLTPCFNQTLTQLTGINCNENRIVSILLSSRGLGGTVSSALANCSFLNMVDFSDNQMTGVIPTELGGLQLLATLNLSVNGLTGSIPEDLSNCTYLNVLDLHRNSLTGVIPQSLGYLERLKVFDVSDNDLSGPIPVSLANLSSGAPRFNISSFRGNKHLYGFPLPLPKNRNLSVLAIVGIGLGSGLISLFISFTAVCIWLRVSEQRLAADEGKISQLMPE
ncbi:hypothetical protein O6H91_06G041600 [Diphasiastrum complanatum]|uniref:Uncharacterized protein n=1 Tax=Diphasiastrum complanatum TaxID=34168 RepID=A0ACC2DCT0_DIPCM|nr:hypothetical protein O6H91_06G041600 [Diphasiastrum complanatum]